MKCTPSFQKRNKLKGLRPFFYLIELNITELCDMKCEFCPRSQGYPNLNLNMPLETIDLIVEQIKDLEHQPIIHLSGRGEPTLHPQFNIILDKLSHLRVKLSTNGNRVDRYLNQINRLHKVDYSIYDESKLTPLEASHKYNFHIVDKRTQNKLKYNNRAGSITKDITRNDPRHPIFGLMCEKPFSVIYINYNGDYNLCCNEWFNPTVLENVQTQSLKDFIKSNEKLKKFQEDLAAGNRTYSPCKSCNKPLHPKAEKYMYKQLLL